MRAIAIRFALLGTACGLLAGCGGSDLPLVPVSGRVTFDGGPCPKAGGIIFVPVADSGVTGLPNRPGRAAFGTDGEFVVTSFEEGDGLLPGRYRVNIECVNGVPGPGTPWESISLVPSDYQPDELVIEEGKGAVEVNYDVPPKKR